MDQQLVSADGRFRLVMQSDGNLVLYQSSVALWDSATGSAGSTASLVDGNLVVYARSGQPLWGTATPGATTLVMQSDGNAVIIGPSGPAWATNTAQPPAAASGSSTLGDNQELVTGTQLVSPGGRYRLVMQSDGNLVLYSGTRAEWDSHSSGAGSQAVLQTDGNLVVYRGNVATFATHT